MSNRESGQLSALSSQFRAFNILGILALQLIRVAVSSLTRCTRRDTFLRIQYLFKVNIINLIPLVAQLLGTAQTGKFQPGGIEEAVNGTCIHNNRGGRRDGVFTGRGPAGGRTDFRQGAGVVLCSQGLTGEDRALRREGTLGGGCGSVLLEAAAQGSLSPQRSVFT